MHAAAFPSTAAPPTAAPRAAAPTRAAAAPQRTRTDAEDAGFAAALDAARDAGEHEGAPVATPARRTRSDQDNVDTSKVGEAEAAHDAAADARGMAPIEHRPWVTWVTTWSATSGNGDGETAGTDEEGARPVEGVALVEDETADATAFAAAVPPGSAQVGTPATDPAGDPAAADGGAGASPSPSAPALDDGVHGPGPGASGQQAVRTSGSPLEISGAEGEGLRDGATQGAERMASRAEAAVGAGDTGKGVGSGIARQDLSTGRGLETPVAAESQAAKGAPPPIPGHALETAGLARALDAGAPGVVGRVQPAPGEAATPAESTTPGERPSLVFEANAPTPDASVASVLASADSSSVGGEGDALSQQADGLRTGAADVPGPPAVVASAVAPPAWRRADLDAALRAQDVNPPPSPEAAAVVEQVVKSVRMQWKQGLGEARIVLRPEHLGPVDVSIKVEAGAVTAVVRAESAQVQEWLVSNEQSLRQQLEAAGLRLDDLVVTPDGERRRQEQEAGQSARRDQRARRRQPSGSEPTFSILA